MSRSNVESYIDNQFPDNTQQLIKPLNARNVVKKLLLDSFNLADDDSDDINEGVVNLFFTIERAADAIAMVIQDSADGKLTWAYDDTNGTFTPTIDLSGVGGSQNIEEVLTEGNDAGGLLIKNIGDGVDPQDAVTKSQLDSTNFIPLCPLVATTTNQNLSTHAVDGVPSPSNALFTGQTDPADNGWYGWNGSNWVRFTSSDVGHPSKTLDELYYYAIFAPQQGSNLGSAFVLNSNVTSYTFIKIGGSSGGAFDPTTDQIGDITATNTAIADNDTVTVFAGKTQGQIDERVTKEDFATLTFGSTVTWACANKQTPLAKVTATGNFALDMTNVKSGAEGILKVTANLTGSFILTFDTDFTNKDLYGTALPTYSFSAGVSGREYFVSYVADGTTLYWNIVDVITLLSGDVTSNSSGVTTIGANKVLLSMMATLANNKVIGNLSGSTATPSALDVQEALVSDTTIQTTLNNNTGWIDDTKTGVTGLLAGQWYQGTSTNGKKYFYVCVTAGTAIRCLAGEGVEASTIPAINPFSIKTASYAVQLTDYAIEFTSVGDATLPSPASNAGQRFCIINNVAAGTTCNVIGTINGAANFALTARYKYIIVMSTGSEYRNVGSN